MSLHKKLIEISYAMSHNMEQDFKHVSFICDKSKIVCVGINKPFKTHPLAYKYLYRYSNIHSELDAILAFPYAIKTLPRYQLYNVRIRNSHTVGLSKPCQKCQKLLFDFRLTNIFYTTGLSTYDFKKYT